MSTSEKIGFEPQSLTMWNLLNRIDGELASAPPAPIQATLFE